MKVCGSCGTTTLKVHKTDKECMLAISREIQSLSSRLTFLLNHLENDSDVSYEKIRLKARFDQMQKIVSR